MKLAALPCIVVTFLASLTGQAADDSQKHVSDGPGVIVYAEGGAFMIEGPSGWIADHDTGQQMGICCVFYPKDSNFDDAETIIYPNIATKVPGQATMTEFMEYDLSEFREHNPGMTYEDGSDIRMKSNRVAKIRYFYGVNKDSSEAIAYIDEDKIIAVIVISSKTRRGLDGAMPRFRGMLETYAYMNVELAPGAAPKRTN
jgi:hypothetical protein